MSTAASAVAAYNGDEVYKLRGFVGYQIDLEFEPGETFVGLGAGDMEGLSFVGQDNHLFLKPKAAKVATNLTVLTSRRHYQFDYTAFVAAPGGGRSGRHLRLAIHLSAGAVAIRGGGGGEAARFAIGQRVGQTTAQHRLLVLRQTYP